MAQVRRVAVLSLHTSPLAQPGTGDGGGMNVYVRELSTSLARSGVACDVFTRSWSPGLATVDVEPGFRVHHIPAGPQEPVPKEDLPDLVAEFSERVARHLDRAADDGESTDALHANYWLSGVAGHAIKHELGIPLVSTFHTLDRLKADDLLGDDILAQVRRAQGESEVMACSDAVVASCSVEAEQIGDLYGLDPARIVVVPPGVDHAYFSPGDRSQARRALGLPTDGAMVLFVGRLQPLKGASVAVEAFSLLAGRSIPRARSLATARGAGAGRSTAPRGEGAAPFLVVVGGPSGPDGPAEVAALSEMVRQLGLVASVHFVQPQPHEFLSTFYRAANVCVVPSRSESFGLVALEASACGTPVVASAVGGLLTLVDHGRTGFLVEERDPAVFARHLETIVRDDTLARTMSSNASARARRYTWRGAATSLTSVYARAGTRQLVECG